MSDHITPAAELLAEHRDSIDRLDAILTYTLAERFLHTKAVGRLSPNMGCRLPTRRVKNVRSRGLNGWRMTPGSTRHSRENS